MPNWVRRLGRRARALLRSGALDGEVAEEIRLHVELETDDLMRTQGLSREEAHRQAMVAFGGVGRYREAHRDARGVRWLEQMGQDLKYAARSLRKSPGFVVTAVVTIALGVGVTTAVYSVVNRLLLNPLPFANADRWRVVGFFDNGIGRLRVSASTDEMDQWARQATTLAASSIVFEHGGLMSTPDHWTEAVGADVAPTLLRSLGVRPIIGRLFGPADVSTGTSRTMVLSERFWRREFAGLPDVLGSSVAIHDTAYSIIGVVPDNVDVLANYDAMDFWSPVTRPESTFFANNRWGVYGVVELKAGVSAARAERELTLLSRQTLLAAGWKPSNITRVRLLRPSDVMNPNLDTGLWVLVAATALVLLIACANVASLQLVRTSRRAPELSVRAALGASRRRLIRQLAVEGVLLSAVGAGAGLLLGSWLLRLVVAFRPHQLSQLDVVHFDNRVVVVGLVLAAVTSVLYSVLPAWYATGGKFAANLHGAAPSRLSQGRGRLQSAVIVGELALSVVLLAGSGLLTRSFARMNAVDPGFRPDGLLELQAALPREAFPDSMARAAFWAALVGRARSINGVSDVVPVPFGMLQSSSGWANTAIETDNPAVVPDTQHVIYSLRRVPGRYFGLLGIRVLAGHPFTPADDRGETNAVVIGAGMARKFWPNTNPVGRRLRLYAQGPWKTVEGVVSDVGLIGPSPENRDLQLYMPPDTAAEFTRAAGIMVRLRPGAGESRTLAALRTAVRSVNRNAVVLTARSERSILDDNLASPRFSTTLMDLFGAMAVLLTLIGLYGVIAFAVGLRTREIGIRVALGARAGDIARGVLRDGLRLALVGLAVGIAVAVGATRLLSSLLYGVGPTDPVVFGGVALALVLVALGASFIPARRAARVDPMIALRAE